MRLVAPDEQVREAFERFQKTYNGTYGWPHTDSPSANGAAAEINDRLRDLHDAAREYVYGPE